MVRWSKWNGYLTDEVVLVDGWSKNTGYLSLNPVIIVRMKHLNKTECVKILLDYGKDIEKYKHWPTLESGAASLIESDPYAFLMAACIDLQTKAEIIWTIPYYIKNRLGHLDPKQLYNLNEKEWLKLIEALPKKPRYKRKAARTLYQLTRLVVDKYNGNAASIWEGKTAKEVIDTLQSIYNVGPGIANMTVLLIMRAFQVRFSDTNHIDIKADTHVMRVMYRLGLIGNKNNKKEAIEAARKLNPEFPGLLDSPLWRIGRDICLAEKPKCEKCPLESCCAKRI